MKKRSLDEVNTDLDTFIDNLPSATGSNEVTTYNGDVSIVLTKTDTVVQDVTFTQGGRRITLPDATTLLTGGVLFKIINNGDITFDIYNHAGAKIYEINSHQTAGVYLLDNTTTGGEWTIEMNYHGIWTLPIVLGGDFQGTNVSDSGTMHITVSIGQSNYGQFTGKERLLTVFKNTSNQGKLFISYINADGTLYSTSALATPPNYNNNSLHLVNLSSTLTVLILKYNSTTVVINTVVHKPSSELLTFSSPTPTYSVSSTVSTHAVKLSDNAIVVLGKADTYSSVGTCRGYVITETTTLNTSTVSINGYYCWSTVFNRGYGEALLIGRYSSSSSYDHSYVITQTSDTSITFSNGLWSYTGKAYGYPTIGSIYLSDLEMGMSAMYDNGNLYYNSSEIATNNSQFNRVTRANDTVNYTHEVATTVINGTDFVVSYAGTDGYLYHRVATVIDKMHLTYDVPNKVTTYGLTTLDSMLLTDGRLVDAFKNSSTGEYGFLVSIVNQ